MYGVLSLVLPQLKCTGCTEYGFRGRASGMYSGAINRGAEVSMQETVI